MLDVCWPLSLTYLGFALAHAPDSRFIKELTSPLPRSMKTTLRILAFGCLVWGFSAWPAPFGLTLAWCAAASALLASGSLHAILEPLFPKTICAIPPLAFSITAGLKIARNFL